jgi:hypothetical protein
MKSQNRRSSGSFRKGLVWDRGGFFGMLQLYHAAAEAQSSILLPP